MNVLSLFDGISCGHVALQRAGIPVYNYYASEVDKWAMMITQARHPGTIQLGDCTKWREWNIDWSSIDLLTAGFPCQAWSIAGKQKGDNDPRGALVHTLIEIWEECKKHNPDLKFLFENVKMKKEFLEYINNLFGVEPIRINSNLVSAQNRDRYYWTNIEGVTQPEDRGILLKDIVHETTAFVDRDKSLCVTTRVHGGASPSHYLDQSMHQMVFDSKPVILQKGRGFNKGGVKTTDGKTPTVGSSSWEQNNKLVTSNVNPSGRGMNGDVIPVTSPKSRTLTTNKGEGGKLSFSLNEYIVPFDKTLQILDKEVQRGKVGYFRKDSQANPVYFVHDKVVTLCGAADGGAAKMGQYLFGCVTPDIVNKNQNGQRFNTGKKFYTLIARDKHGILIEGYIRKLTPIECERLQTLEDDYTLVLDDNGKQLVSNTQRYKSVGNGWTVDVISHILKNLNVSTHLNSNPHAKARSL